MVCVIQLEMVYLQFRRLVIILLEHRKCCFSFRDSGSDSLLLTLQLGREAGHCCLPGTAPQGTNRLGRGSRLKAS